MKSTHVLILGAGGAIAQHVIQMLNDKPSIKLTLLVREASQLNNIKAANATIVVGDVLNAAQLSAAIKGQDIVYANLKASVGVNKPGVHGDKPTFY